MMAMPAHAIDAADPDWTSPSPTLLRPTLAVGTTLELHGYTRPLVHRELGWLHAALSGLLGRGHDPGGPGSSLRTQAWSVVPWPAQSGCGVVWWDELDGLALARTCATSRIGRVPVKIALGSAVRIHSPPQWIPGAYPVRLTTRSLVSIASVDRHGSGTRRVYEHACQPAIESALWSVARKLRIQMSSAPRVHVLADRTRSATVYLRGKVGRVSGWEGSVDLLASAPARWLLECASRGLGLGGRAAYGCGAVTLVDIEGGRS